jgi:hypothetical protein
VEVTAFDLRIMAGFAPPICTFSYSLMNNVLSGGGANDELRRLLGGDPGGRLEKICLAIAASQ